MLTNLHVIKLVFVNIKNFNQHFNSFKVILSVIIALKSILRHAVCKNFPGGPDPQQRPRKQNEPRAPTEPDHPWSQLIGFSQLIPIASL